MALIHLRVLGYLATLFLHITNLAMMQTFKTHQLTSDMKINLFRRMTYRYFTCWTVMLQIVYAAFGLYCDVKVLTSSDKKYQLPGSLRGLRNLLFSALVWPCSLLVFTVFWSLFLYDRSLIFPEFIDQVISSTSNHILHTVIVPVVLWEVLCWPRVRPSSHLRNIVQLAVHMVAYLSVLYYTYISEGIWLYPIFHVTFGSVHFVFLHLYVIILLLFFYHLQWWFNYIVHGSQKSTINKVK